MSNFTGTPDSKLMSELPDGELMLALQNGRDVALDQLMKRHKQPLFYFVTRYTRDEDVSYDIVQEAFFRVYDRAETYNPSYRFKTWLYQIALNLCRDYTRFPNGKGWFGTEAIIEHSTNQPLGELYSEILYYEDIVERASKRLEVYKSRLNVDLT